MSSVDSFGAKGALEVGDNAYEIYRLSAVAGEAGIEQSDVDSLPFSLKVMLENLLRTEDGENITADDVRALAGWDADVEPSKEIQFSPARVIMQDFTGVPCVVDLATMREAMADLGGDATRINPLAPAELVIDHSVIADVFGTRDSFARNVEIEYGRNKERYQFLRWGQGAFDDFKVVPPGTGIVHQVNIEHLARVTFTRESDGSTLAYPDTCVGTDSHTTMVNGLGVVGWGVGGIEAEAAMLGQPISMLIPRVVGFKLNGELPQGTTATDLVLTITQMLRQHGVVGKFVEFYGPGVAAVPLANRATIGNMSPEYGSTIAVFPIDEETLTYMRLTGRSDEHVALVEAYCQGAGPVARPRPRAALLRVPRARPRRRRPVDRRAEASAGPGLADRGQGGASGPRWPTTSSRTETSRATTSPSTSRSPPPTRPPATVAATSEKPRQAVSARATDGGRPSSPVPMTLGGRHRVRGRPRRRGDRRHHLVHQHVQPVGDARRPRCWPRRRSSVACRASRGSRRRWRPAPRWSWTTTSGQS